MTTYESRIGKVSAPSCDIFGFISDMRNFRQFLHDNALKNWSAEEDRCEFEISPVGKAKINIVNKDPFKTVKFAGDGLNNTDFNLWVQLKELAIDDTRVKITIKAELNPMVKMMAAKPIKEFLDKLVDGMESFNKWKSPAE